ncbi:hypothetical protein ACMFMG_003186 [Clarireedia jacksonii]
MRYSAWYVVPAMVVALLSPFTMAIDEVVQSDLEMPANGYVMGGPKSGFQDKTGGVAVAEKATNLADTVQAMDIADLAKGLENPYEVIFGINSTDKVKGVQTGTNATTGTNSTASANNTLPIRKLTK